ncbi:MAG: hypothetical protein WA190_17710 [Usitatibacter sp.]
MDNEKQPTKKPATEQVASEVALADICKGLKMEPRAARRLLRSSDVKVEGHRWAWKKNSPEIAKVTKLLKDSIATK